MANKRRYVLLLGLLTLSGAATGQLLPPLGGGLGPLTGNIGRLSENVGDTLGSATDRTLELIDRLARNDSIASTVWSDKIRKHWSSMQGAIRQ